MVRFQCGHRAGLDIAAQLAALQLLRKRCKLLSDGCAATAAKVQSLAHGTHLHQACVKVAFIQDIA